MKVQQMIEELQKIDADKEIVVQKSQGENGEFSLHIPVIWQTGHIGHDGPVIHIGPCLEQPTKASV